MKITNKKQQHTTYLRHTGHQTLGTLTPLPPNTNLDPPTALGHQFPLLTPPRPNQQSDVIIPRILLLRYNNLFGAFDVNAGGGSWSFVGVGGLTEARDEGRECFFDSSFLTRGGGRAVRLSNE